jgi:hypothetical protein
MQRNYWRERYLSPSRRREGGAQVAPYWEQVRAAHLTAPVEVSSESISVQDPVKLLLHA